MMMALKQFLASVLIFLSGCAHTTYQFPYTDDTAARQAQNEMQSTVYVEMSYHAVGLVVSSSGQREIDNDMGWSGTGVVISVKDGKSTILTAGHVVATPPAIEFGVGADGMPAIAVMDVSDIKMTVQTLDGRTCEAHVTGKYSKDDLGLMVADCVAGIPAHMAESLPPVGAHVETVGCPDGVHAVGSFSILDGRYQGLAEEQDSAGKSLKESISVPAVGGVSGAGLYYRGNLVGIVVAGSRNFEHTAYAVSLDTIKAFLNK